MDIPTLAERLGTSVRHVRRLVFERRIPYMKCGGLVRFDPDAIDRWLDEATHPVGTISLPSRARARRRTVPDRERRRGVD